MVHATSTIFNNISGARVFHNNADNEQMLVRLQLTTTLSHFGHYGNVASMQQSGLRDRLVASRLAIVWSSSGLAVSVPNLDQTQMFSSGRLVNLNLDLGSGLVWV